MDRRVFLALILSAAVVVLTQILFPPPKRAIPTTAADSARAGLVAGRDTAAAGAAATAATAAVATPAAGAAPTPVAGAAPADSAAARAPEQITTVTTPKGSYRLSSRGARPVALELAGYEVMGPKGKRTGTPVQLVRPRDALLGFRLVVPGDTIPLDQVDFAVTQGQDAKGHPQVDYTAALPAGARIAIRYSFAPDSYLVRVTGRVDGVPRPAFLLAELPGAIANNEADSLDDQSHRAIAYKSGTQNAKGLEFNRMKYDDRVVQPGPLTWAVNKSKYFIVGLLVPRNGTPFSEIQVVPEAKREAKGFFGTRTVTTAARATVVQPLPTDGTFAFEMYAGPQEFQRLESLGRDFENTNPYGGWLQGVVQPFATIVMRTLLWMKRNLPLSYGWILVIFGIGVRLVMWPLQQGAMRSSMKMQRIQPQMQAIQEKYRNDPARLQQEMMKVYKEHGVSPFSMFSGCLPMLIPMPIFFALFFVFRNTIEFRGVPFMWLPDISLHDPYYILPVVMGLSSWLLAWVGMRNAPPNPQAKMMSYMFPGMMVLFLWNYASGLNLYYTIQNLAALPQQWMLANERAKTKK